MTRKTSQARNYGRFAPGDGPGKTSKRLYRSKPVGPAPGPASGAVSRSMKSNKSSGTVPELVLARLLRRRIVINALPGKPDFVYSGARLAVFVHGCFWHRCPTCNLPLPRTHSEYWRRKFERNIERDELNKEELHRMGWRVVEVWEHELRKNPHSAVRRIQTILSQR